MNTRISLPDLPRACSFDAGDWVKLAHHWYPVALSRDIAPSPASAMLLDAPLVIYRVGAQTIVADDLCPHHGVPLSLGRHHDEGGIVCAYHGLRFGENGRCNRIPAQPNAPIPANLRLRTYPVIERYGLIWTCLRPVEPSQVDVPQMPHWDDSAFQQIVCPFIDIHGFAGRQMEGFLDVAHFGFVHTATFGDPANTIVPRYVPQATEKGFEVEYRSAVGNYPIGATIAADPDSSGCAIFACTCRSPPRSRCISPMTAGW
jgi:phenylpropionate dioxygenase-like ring-hydroxylating dioxygenase large terminal subunit